MKVGKYWFRRRWLDGRNGHTFYLMFALTFTNFILISYRFLIEGNSLLQSFVSDLWLFTLIFTVAYVPVSILIGHWHRDTQWKTELILKQLENPINAKMFRTMLDVQTGRASKGEIEEFRKFLTQIEKEK